MLEALDTPLYMRPGTHALFGITTLCPNHRNVIPITGLSRKILSWKKSQLVAKVMDKGWSLDHSDISLDKKYTDAPVQLQQSWMAIWKEFWGLRDYPFYQYFNGVGIWMLMMFREASSTGMVTPWSSMIESPVNRWLVKTLVKSIEWWMSVIRPPCAIPRVVASDGVVVSEVSKGKRRW